LGEDRVRVRAHLVAYAVLDVLGHVVALEELLIRVRVRVMARVSVRIRARASIRARVRVRVRVRALLQAAHAVLVVVDRHLLPDAVRALEQLECLLPWHLGQPRAALHLA